MSTKVKVVTNILKANQNIAEELKIIFEQYNILVYNLISSPGSGKTTLLGKTIELLNKDFNIAVIEGDIATSNDADKISVHDIPVVQINTGGGCHLDSNMVKKAVEDIELDDIDILFIENVGNLVCPTNYDLGEDHKVVLTSIVEGEDKPEKYPEIYIRSDIFIISKMDLQSYVNCDIKQMETIAKRLNNNIDIIKLSSITEHNFEMWLTRIKNDFKYKTKV